MGLLQGLPVEKAQGCGAITHDELRPVPRQSPSFSHICELSGLCQRFGLVNQAKTCAPGELIEFFADRSETLAEQLFGQTCFLEQPPQAQVHIPDGRRSVTSGALEQLAAMDDQPLGDGIPVVRVALHHAVSKVHRHGGFAGRGKAYREKQRPEAPRGRGWHGTAQHASPAWRRARKAQARAVSRRRVVRSAPFQGGGLRCIRNPEFRRLIDA